MIARHARIAADSSDHWIGAVEFATKDGLRPPGSEAGIVSTGRFLMSTGSKHRTMVARAIAGTLLAAGGLVASAVPAHAGGLNSAPKWQDGSIGASLGCAAARTWVNPHVCDGMFGYPVG